MEGLLVKTVPLVLPAYTLPALSTIAPSPVMKRPFYMLPNAGQCLPPCLSLCFYLHHPVTASAIFLKYNVSLGSSSWDNIFAINRSF